MRKIQKAMKCKNAMQLLSRILVVGIMLSITAVCVMQPASADNTYIITDGNTVIVHVSSTTDVQDVIEEAGFTLGMADKYTATETPTGNTQIQIQRVQKITVNCDGKKDYYGTYGDSVGNILSALNITLSEEDRVSYPLSRKTFDGMVIDVIRVTHKTVEYEETVDCGFTYYEDPSLAAGETLVLEAGRSGTVHRKDHITYENGVEVRREVLSENVVVAPTKGIALCGPGTIDGATGTSKTISCLGTAYSCDGRPGITATGTVVHLGTVAVDPKVIPLGSKLYITSDDGKYVYGYATAEDTGGLIKGNRVDLYYNTTEECIQFGARRVTVRVLKG